MLVSGDVDLINQNKERHQNNETLLVDYHYSHYLQKKNKDSLDYIKTTKKFSNCISKIPINFV
jgi:hypothetical protein